MNKEEIAQYVCRCCRDGDSLNSVCRMCWTPEDCPTICALFDLMKQAGPICSSCGHPAHMGRCNARLEGIINGMGGLSNKCACATHVATTIDRCSICSCTRDVRHHDLYIIGSEGVRLCHDCEMGVLNYLRSLCSTATRSRLEIIKENRRR
jgi:hypothetical protein